MFVHSESILTCTALTVDMQAILVRSKKSGAFACNSCTVGERRMLRYCFPLIISRYISIGKKKTDALALQHRVGIKKSPLFLPCSWMYPYLLCPLFPMPDLEQRLPQMLWWNINKVNSKCMGWKSLHHIWDQEMLRVVLMRSLPWLCPQSFGSEEMWPALKAVTLWKWIVLFVSFQSAFRNRNFQKFQDASTMEINFRHHFLSRTCRQKRIVTEQNRVCKKCRIGILLI